MFKVMITGNRPFKLDKDKAHIAREKMHEYLKDLKSVYGNDLVILTGMALGPDQWAAEICINLGIKFVAYLPFKGQELRWTTTQQSKYLKMLIVASEVKVASDVQSNSAYLRRNGHVVNDCDCAIAVFNGDYKSGTGSTVRKLEYAKIPYINVYDIKTQSIKEEV